MAFLDNLKNAMKTKAKEKQAQRPVQPVRPTTTADSFKNFLLSKQSRENILNTVQQRRQIEQPRQTATQNITGSQRSVSNLPTSTNKIGLTSNSSTSQYKRTTQKDIDNLKNEMRKRGASEEDINKRISELQQGKTNLPTQKALTDEDRKNFTPLVTEEDKKTGELKARTKTFYDSISEKLRNVRDVAENDVSKIVAIGGESIIPAFDNVIKGFGNLEEMWGREGTDLAMRMMSKTPFTLKDGSGEAGRFTFADTMGISKEDIEEVAKIDEAIRGVESSPIKELNKTPVEADYKGAINRIKDKSGLTQWSEDLKQAMAENQEGIQSKGGQYIGNLTPSLVQNGLNMVLSAINPAVGTASFGASGFSSYFDEARNKGMNTRQATKYGTTMATLDSAFEQLIVFNRIDNIKGVFKGNSLLKYGLGLGKDVGENYLQEAVMEPAGQVVENLVTGQNPLTGLNDPELWQRAREEGRAGAFSSLILSFVGLGGGSIVQNESQQQAFETIDNIEQKLEDNKKLDTKDVADGIKAINSLGFDAESIINQNGEIIANALVEKSTQQQNPQTEQGFKNTMQAIRNGATVQEAVQENLSEMELPTSNVIAETQREYKGEHQIDTQNTTSLDNLNVQEVVEKVKKINGALSKQDTSDLNRLEKIVNNIEEKVTIYRASPVKELNNGDWVTLDKNYAQNVAKENGGKVYSYEVNANELLYPNNVKDLPSLHRLSSFQYQETNKQNSNTDNQGRTLSKGQQEYFKDSKVRDEKGNLLTVYHGTPNGEFTVFDKDMIGSTTDEYGRGDYGSGFYFTNVKEGAESYAEGENGKVIEAYLDLKNPLRVDLYQQTQKNIREYMRENHKNVLSMTEQDWKNVYDNSPLSEEEYNKASDVIDRFEDDYAFDNLEDLEKLGYDGVIAENMNQIVALRPEQIKRVDNTNPTTNADILKQRQATYEQLSLDGFMQNNGGKLTESIFKQNEDNIKKATKVLKESGTKVETKKRKLANDFITKGYIDLNGKKVNNVTDVVDIAQIFRNPMYETFRIIYTKGDVIVGQEAVSSKTPGFTNIMATKEEINTGNYYEDLKQSRVKGFYKIKNRMSRLEADGYYMIHNHPSGRAKASSEDILTTERFGREIKGFKGHIIVNSGTYSFIDTNYKPLDFQEIKNYKPDEIDKMVNKDPFYNTTISSRSSLIDLAFDLKNNPNYSTMIFTDAQNKISLVLDIPNNFFNMSKEQINGYVRNTAKKNGVTRCFLATQNLNVLSKAKETNVLMDAVLYGLNEKGEMLSKDFLDSNHNSIFEFEDSYAVRVGEERSQYEDNKKETDIYDNRRRGELQGELNQEDYNRQANELIDNANITDEEKTSFKDSIKNANFTEEMIRDLRDALKVMEDNSPKKLPTRNPKQDLGYFKKNSNDNLLQEVDKEVTRQNEYEAQKQKDKEEGKTRPKLPENTISKNNFKKQVEQDKASKYKGKAERYYIRAKNNFINKVTETLDISKGSNKQILNDTIDKIENTIREKGEITSSERDNLFEEMFDNVVKIDDEYYNQYKDLKKEVANEKIFVDEQAVKEIASQYDGFNNFRKKNFGNLNLSTKASSDSVSIDRVYQELQSAYGNLFPDNIYNTGEQLQYIADVVSDIKKSEMNLSSYDDEVLGGELRQYARQEFDGFVDNLISEYNRTERYKEDRRQSEIESKKKTKSSTQEVKDKYSQIPELRRQYEKASNSELLTERDRTELDRLFKGEITLDDIKPGLNRKGIEEVYKAGKKYKKLSDQLKTDRGNIKKGYVSKANDFIGDLSQWKDKKQGWRYTRETAVRNFLDIAPKDIAERINDEYIYKYAENEANRTRFINEQVNKIKDLKLNTRKKYNATFQVQERDSNGNLVDTKTTRKVSEAELVQIYGEGRISKTELQETGADVKKIENAVSTFRDSYNELLDLTNNVLIETGHAPVPKREDYFPHFEEGQDTTLQKVGKALGIDLTGKELPTSIAGQTQNFKPDKTWVGNFLERKTNITDFNVLKGFDRYINGVSDVIYHTEDIMKMRGLETAIRQFYADDKIKERIDKVLENPDLTEEERYEEIRTITNQSMDKAHLSNFINWYGDYVNSLAGKKSASDRGVEKELSRKYYQAINKVQSRYSANAIGGNISVALTNTGVIFSAIGETNPVNLVIGAYKTAENNVKSLLGKGDDSFVSMSDFLTSRRGTESAYESGLDKAVKPINKLVNSFDNFSTEAVVRAKYAKNIRSGMTQYEALENADNFARGLIADRSKGMLPTQFNKTNPIAKLMNAFQVEANNQLSYMFKDLNRNVIENAESRGWSKAKAVERLTLAYTGLFVGNFLVNEILGRVRGNQTRLLIDPIYMLKEMIKGFTDDDDDNDYATLKNTFEEIIGQLPFAQVPVALFGESIGLDSSKIGRVPIAGAVPNISKTVKSWTYTDKNGNKRMSDPKYILQEHWKEYQKPLLNLALPYGGMQLKKTANAIDTMVKGEKTRVDQEGKESIKYVVQDKGVINSTKALLFGDTARSEYQEYAENGYKGLTSKQTELYREMKIPYKEFLDYTKMNFESDKDKNGKAISGSSKAKRLEWILNSKMSDKNKDLMIQSAFSTDKSKDSLKNYKYVNKDYSTLLYYSNLSSDDKAEYNKMAKAGINQKQYIAYKNKIKALTKAGKLTASTDDNVNKQKKIEELMKSNLSAKDKALIYELDIGSKDNYYKYYKASGMNINEYLKYQTQDFESDKIDDGTLKGKTISGSLKAKKVSYVNSMNITYEQKLLLLGSQYSLSKQERSIVANYINGLKMSAQDKLDLYAKMKGFTVYKDGRVSF